MEVIHGHFDSSVVVTQDTIFHGTVTGNMTVLPGVHLELIGNILGNLFVESDATVTVWGVVSDAVINRGGVVEVYGAVGSITGTERTHINPGAQVDS